MKTLKKELVLRALVNEKKSTSSLALELSLSEPTVKRYLSQYIAEGLVTATKFGRKVHYSLSVKGRLFLDFELNTYFSREQDERLAQTHFNFELIDGLNDIDLFSPHELTELNDRQKEFRVRVSELSNTAYKKEMERLGIDLSWKSSQIEGNTYTLLETEDLLKNKNLAKGKTRDEAIMLLNHKEALDVIASDPDFFKELTIGKIENIHSILIQELDVERNIRKRRVAITGTNYVPLDNEFNIREALQMACDLINSKSNVFEKAFLCLLLIAYIQPFTDGNKRTSRILANAVLLSQGYCPMSFRTVSSLEYKMGMLLFYEQNTIGPFKRIFIDQFKFSTANYF